MDALSKELESERLNEARLDALLQLSLMGDASLQELTDFALKQAVVLTASQIGYLAFVNDDETVLTMHSWSKEAMLDDQHHLLLPMQVIRKLELPPL